MPCREALYPGSFDPPTLGHLDLIKRGLKAFENVTVAVVRNPGKNPLFTPEERVDLLRQVTKDLHGVKVEAFDGLLVDFVRAKGNPVVLRGLRVLSDFEYEFQMALMNRKLFPDFEVVYMMPDERYTYLSSSLVREAATLGARSDGFVPPEVEEAMKRKLGLK